MPPTAAAAIAVLRGGEWLLRATEPDAVFTPERLTEEHRLIARTTEEFVDNEVVPALDRLEEKDWPLARLLLRTESIASSKVEGMQMDVRTLARAEARSGARRPGGACQVDRARRLVRHSLGEGGRRTDSPSN